MTRPENLSPCLPRNRHENALDSIQISQENAISKEQDCMVCFGMISLFMFQAVYQTNFYFKVGGGFFGLHPQFGYTYIPNPGQRPDLPAAHVFSLRLITLF